MTGTKAKLQRMYLVPISAGVGRSEDARLFLHRLVEVAGGEDEPDGRRLGQDGHHVVERVQLLELLRQV